MTDDYFYKLNTKFTFMDIVYAELDSAIWYESKYKQCRFDVSQKLRSII